MPSSPVRCVLAVVIGEHGSAKPPTITAGERMCSAAMLAVGAAMPVWWALSTYARSGCGSSLRQSPMPAVTGAAPAGQKAYGNRIDVAGVTGMERIVAS
jgi:hypothetical protein